jgi:hypothetical protein
MGTSNGYDNPDDAQRCGSCGVIWRKPGQAKPEPGKGNWVMPLIGVLLVGLAAVLAVFVNPTWAFIAALLAFCSAISAIRKSWSKWKFRGRAVSAGIVILSSLFMLTLSYLRIDAAPISDDYTISDLRSAPAECDQTYELLAQLTDVDFKVHSISAIGLSAQETRRLDEIHDLCKGKDLGSIAPILQDNASEIIDMWQHAEKGRQVITTLNEFPEIADLGQPSMEIARSWYVSLRHLAHLHGIYIRLQSSQGSHKTAVDTLLIYESFVRKLSMNARSMITNLVCIACSKITIDTANFIINNPETPHELLVRLERSMIPLRPEHTSLRNALISEYIVWKKELLKMSPEIHLKYRYRALAPLKLNSTLRLSKNFLGGVVAIEEGATQTKELKVWPALYPNLAVEIGHDGKLPLYYEIYNPVGAKLIGILAPAVNRVRNIRTKLQVHSDLLKIVLDRRLGREVNLKARAYGDECIVDLENRKIFSPGPDGKPGTKDDIKLPINPEVLGWGD